MIKILREIYEILALLKEAVVARLSPQTKRILFTKIA